MKKSLIKTLALVLLTSALILILSGCGNRQFLDMTYTFTYARIYTPDGQKLVEGKVSSWRDYEDGDQIQVVINGATYLTHASLVILSTE